MVSLSVHLILSLPLIIVLSTPQVEAFYWLLIIFPSISQHLHKKIHYFHPDHNVELASQSSSVIRILE